MNKERNAAVAAAAAVASASAASNMPNASSSGSYFELHDSYKWIIMHEKMRVPW